MFKKISDCTWFRVRYRLLADENKNNPYSRQIDVKSAVKQAGNVDFKPFVDKLLLSAHSFQQASTHTVEACFLL